MGIKYCPFKTYRSNNGMIPCASNCALYVNGACAFVVKIQQDAEIKDDIEQLLKELKSINRD